MFSCWFGETENAPVSDAANCATVFEDKGTGCFCDSRGGREVRAWIGVEGGEVDGWAHSLISRRLPPIPGRTLILLAGHMSDIIQWLLQLQLVRTA